EVDGRPSHSVAGAAEQTESRNRAMKTMRTLLILPLILGFAACDDEEPTAQAGPTVVEVAQQVNAETGEFSTLLAAVIAAGLADDLSAEGQRTVFAPTDAAFEALG